jgi:RimJ/RimL family protein N-acetyltransferase
MPFFVAWTDTLTVESFLDHHLGLRRDWRPENWQYNPTVWLDGAPIGSIGMRGKDFVRERVVDTGSWLGERHQGGGLGTEMRTAILTLAFDRLGAVAATSGYIEGNRASARVSEKLGYEPAGEETVSPRGVPMRELQLRLERARWDADEHAPVEIVGLEPCLPLFGL